LKIITFPIILLLLLLTTTPASFAQGIPQKTIISAQNLLESINKSPEENTGNAFNDLIVTGTLYLNMGDDKVKKLLFERCDFVGGISSDSTQFTEIIFAKCTFGQRITSAKYQRIDDTISFGLSGGTVLGDLIFDSCIFYNSISILREKIVGSLDLKNCEILIPMEPDPPTVESGQYFRKIGLHLTDSKIGRDFIFRDSTSNTPVRLEYVEIEKNLTLDYLTIKDSIYSSLAIAYVDIGKKFSVEGLVTNGHVEFADLSCDIFSDGFLDQDREPVNSMKINSGLYLRSGFSFNNFDPETSTDLELRLQWIRDNHKNYALPQEYLQIARIYDEMGRYSDKREILIAMEKDMTSMNQYGIAMKSLRHVYGLTTAYGYKPWWLLGYMLLFVVTGFFVFKNAIKRAIMVPLEAIIEQSDLPNDQVKSCTLSENDDDTSSEAPQTLIELPSNDSSQRKTKSNKINIPAHSTVINNLYEVHEVPQTYPHPRPLLYSIDLILPVVGLRQVKYWYPSTKCHWTCWYATIHVLAGWLMTTLVVVAIVDLIKQ